MGTPLTEETFLKYVLLIDKRFTGLETRMSGLETRMSGLETRMSGLETRMSGLESQMKEVLGFQKKESDTIEFELQMLLQNHLSLKYPLQTPTKFPMKRLYNPFTDDEITELDAAFLLNQIVLKQNYSRLRAAGIYKTYMPDTLDEPVIFVMAEAKHSINAGKVAEKLNQFDLIRQMFYVAKHGSEGMTDMFRKTLHHNKFMKTIDTCILFFGAAYWGPGLLQKLQEAVKSYKKMASEFESATLADEKVTIFRKALELDSRWRKQPIGKLPPTEYIAKTRSLEGSLKYVDFIIPSGSRYVIPIEKAPEPWITRGGALIQTRVTRKVRA